MRATGQLCNSKAVKATKWTLTFQRLVCPSMGIQPRLMQQLFNAIVVPKMVYATDMWYTPMYLHAGRERCSGSVGFTHRLASVQ